jgi:DNA mismatch repair protein MutS2
VKNASVEFDVETLSPTFRLLLGQPGLSNALSIAERLGVPGEVVERAREQVRPADRESQEVLARAQEIHSRAERHLRDAEGMRSRTRELERRAEDERREAADRRRHVEKEAENEMDAALSRVRKLVLEFGKEMANAPKPFGPRAMEFVDRAEEEIRATPLMRRREEFALGLRRGDEVFVPKLGERFQVHAVRKKDRTVTVLRGSLRMDVDFADVTWVG